MKTKTIFIWVTLFSIAMGMLESAVVVYLRELYYPEGFAFPLKIMSATVVFTELLREVATLIMLIAIGVLAGRTKTEKFGYFIYSFAIWDILYYVFLKLLLNWPESLFSWDILFMLPTTWVAPVVCPVLLALAMITLALSIIYFTNKSVATVISKTEWWFFILGSLICIISFTYEYSIYILHKFSWYDVFIPTKKLMDYAIQFVPVGFLWWVFWLGFIIILGTIGHFIYRNLKQFYYSSSSLNFELPIIKKRISIYK